MAQSTPTNRRIVLNARPRGAPTAFDFRSETAPVPTSEAGQMLLHTLYQSLDPYMRGRKSDGPPVLSAPWSAKSPACSGKAP